MSRIACLRLFLPAVALLAAGCSTDPVSGGGSDLPNGTTIAGTVTLQDSTALAGALVTLKKIVVTPAGDSVLREEAAVTDGSGLFSVTVSEPDRYALYCRSGDGRHTALDQFVTVGPGDGPAGLPLVARPPVDVIGYVDLPGGCFHADVRISVPGAGISSVLAPDHSFRLASAPQGTYDIAVLYRGIANHMRVTVSADPLSGPVYLRTIRFAFMPTMGDTAELYHQTTARESYYITPNSYPSGREPNWYHIVNMENVDYYNWADGAIEPWHGDTFFVPTVYDTVLAGLLFRDDGDRFMIETIDSHVIPVTGQPLLDLRLPAGGRMYAVVAIRLREENGVLLFEVIGAAAIPPAG